MSDDVHDKAESFKMIDQLLMGKEKSVPLKNHKRKKFTEINLNHTLNKPNDDNILPQR